MRKVLIVACCLMNCMALAQEQISNFDGKTSETPSNVQKLDTINGKLVFRISRNEYQESRLWHTDGNPENTHLLRDEKGNIIDSSPWMAKAYGYIYMNFPYASLYRTKGGFLEMVMPKPDSLLYMTQFNAKLLLYFGHYEQSPYGKNLNFSHLDRLNVDNSVTRLADNVMQYQIIDSTLHYISTDYQTGNLELGSLDRNGKLTKNIVLANGIEYIVSSFQYFSINGHDFYFLYTDKGIKLLRKLTDSSENISVIDWGEESDFPKLVRDTAGKIYFLKYSTLLKFYALENDNTLSEKWSVSTKNIKKVEPYSYNGVLGYQSFQITGDKLIFNAITVSIATYGFYIHIFDLKTGTNKVSKNLYPFSSYGPTTINISLSDTNTFVADNKIGTRVTYDFGKDTIKIIEKYPYIFPHQADTYPEIVQGTEGIESNILFEFKNQIYIYGFTYTHGWQVWKMGKSKVIITGTELSEGLPAALQVFPNPTQDRIYVTSETTLSYQLINIRGQVLMQGNLNPHEGIDLKSLAQGVYIIQLFDGSRVFVKKVVKQ